MFEVQVRPGLDFQSTGYCFYRLPPGGDVGDDPELLAMADTPADALISVVADRCVWVEKAPLQVVGYQSKQQWGAEG